MRRKRTRVPDDTDLGTTYGYGEDLTTCYRQLAAQGRDRFDEEAAKRLLFNHVTVRAIALKFLYPRTGKLAGLLGKKRKYENERRSAGQAREEADDFLAWLFGVGRYGVLCDTALCAEDWADFPYKLSGGDGLRNLMFDYLRGKMRRPEKENADYESLAPLTGVRKDVTDYSVLMPLARTDADLADSGPAPSWFTAEHVKLIRSRVEYDLEYSQDRQRGFALYLLSLPYVGDVEKTAPEAVQARFAWLPPDAAGTYAVIRARWLERMEERKKKRDEHLRRRRSLLLASYGSEKKGAKEAERKVWLEQAEKYLHNAGRCELEMVKLYDRLADETDIQKLLGLASALEGRNVRKRAWRYLHQIIQDVTGRKLPTSSERRRMRAEENARPAVC